MVTNIGSPSVALYEATCPQLLELPGAVVGSISIVASMSSKYSYECPLRR